MLHGMVARNNLKFRDFRYHADVAHPDVAGKWLGEAHTEIDAYHGQVFRPRFNQTRQASAAPDTLTHQIQYRWRAVYGEGGFGVWARVNNISSFVRTVTSAHYEDLDLWTTFFMDPASFRPFAPRQFYRQGSNNGLVTANWQNRNGEAMECELAFGLQPEAIVGSELRFRIKRGNGDAHEFVDTYVMALRVVEPPGAMDEAIATVLDVAGVGDFSAPATAATPVIVVGQLLAKPDAMVGVFLGGGSTDRVIGEAPKVTILSRDLGYTVARDRADAVADALHEYSGAQLGRVIARVSADTSPTYRGRDGTGYRGGRHVWAQTFSVLSRNLLIH